ncbi:relaxase/mobilization nuclease domain-containing protein [Pacificispira sp.]|uniref:relaxase/mobilization nuclease domain-containing protein n=1 Tax=Pacificispira sp. TaxID=2888761 RepID=UPI003B51A47D
MRFKVPKRQPESFKASALYLAGRVKDLSPDRVEFVFANNLQTTDPRAAAAVMEATAAKSVRCKQPAYHFIVTFDPADDAAGKVTEQVKREIAGKVIEDMGLTEHQALVYSHKDTDHPHLHFLVNRIHPTEHIAYDRHRDGTRLKEIVRERAREYGLNILKDRELLREMERVDDLNDGGTVSDAEYWRAKREGRSPQVPFSKDAIQSLRERLYDDCGRAVSWDDLAGRLEAHGLTLERKGQGIVLTNGERFAKLSEMGKGIRMKSLEARFDEKFDGYMVRRAGELARGERPHRGPDTAGMTEKERRTVEILDQSEPDHGGSRHGDPALEADAADMDYRYWSQVEATHRAGRSRVKTSERDEARAKLSEARQKAWVSRREESFVGLLGKVFRDPERARNAWGQLERKHGVNAVRDMIKKNPLLLGSFGADEKEAQRLSRYLTERYDKYREAMHRLDHARSKVERARHKTKLAIRDFEMLEQSIGSGERLRRIVVSKIRRRSRALSRLTNEAIRRSTLADDRKEQLERARRLQKERQLERSRKREHSKALGIDLDD